MAHDSGSPQPSSTAEFIKSAVWLTLAVVLALPVSLWWADGFAGQTGMLASAIAAVLCWLAGGLALVVRMQFPKPQDVVPATMGAMLVRMVVVMGGGMALAARFPELAKAALWGQIIVFFFLTLFVETLLAVRWVKSLESRAVQNGSNDQSPLAEGDAKAV